MEKVKLIVSPHVDRGAKVIGETTHENGPYPLKYFTLDREHPSGGGKISVGQDDVHTAEFPLCCYAEESAPMAERLYAAYNCAGPLDRAGITFDGRPVPTWKELQAKAAGGDVGAAAVIEKWKAVDLFSDLWRR